MHDAYKNHKVLKKTSLWNLSLNFLYQIEIDSQTTDNTIRFSLLLQWIFDFKCIYFSDINGHLQQQQQQPQHQQQQPQHQQQHQQQQQSVPQIIICNPPAASQSLSQPQQSTPSSFVPNPAPAQQPPSIVILGGQGGNPSSQGNNQLQGRL